MACRSERVPTDYYGETLAALVAEGVKNPEMVAAVIAAVAESIEDTLKMCRRPCWIGMYFNPATFATKEPPPC